MRNAEDIEREIRDLPRAEYSKLRDWFLEQDAAAWDAKFETDVKAGKFEKLAAAARQAHTAGKTTKLGITSPHRSFGFTIERCQRKSGRWRIAVTNS